MLQNKRCPNCEQFKVIKVSTLRWLLAFIFVFGIFIITLPFELILIPAAIIAALIPATRTTYDYCRNCKWSSKVTPATV